MSQREKNIGLWAGFVNASASNNFKDIALNKDLFNRMVVPACFNQCAKTDVDIVFMNEMECAYKCMITYKQSVGLLSDIDRQ